MKPSAVFRSSWLRLAALGAAGLAVACSDSDGGEASDAAASGSDARVTGDAGALADARPSPSPSPDAGVATDASTPNGLTPFPAACEPAPAARHEGGARLTLTIKPKIGGQALVRGTSYTVGTAAYTLSQVRFFVTHVELVDAAGARTLGQLVDDAGAPLPYDTQLFDLEKPESATLRVRAPAGTYSGLTVGVGLAPACNVSEPARAVYPLNPSGSMTWTWTLGYIFMRIEGTKVDGAAIGMIAAHGGATPPSAGAARLEARAPFTLGAAGTRMDLAARFDDLLAPAANGAHLVAGAAVMEVLPRTPFFSLSASP